MFSSSSQRCEGSSGGSRLYHISIISLKKGTQAARNSRIANAAGVDQSSAEFEQIQQLLKTVREQQHESKHSRGGVGVEVNLFEIDRYAVLPTRARREVNERRCSGKKCLFSQLQLQ